MSQYSQLNGAPEIARNDIYYASALITSLLRDLDAVVNKGDAYTVSRAKLIQDKGILVNDLKAKWDTKGGIRAIADKWIDSDVRTHALDIGQNYLKLAGLIDKLPKDFVQETTPEAFPKYERGKPWVSTPQAFKGIFSEPSPETLAKLLVPYVYNIGEQQRKEIETQGYVSTPTRTSAPAVTETKKGGVPILAIAGAAAALYFLNK